MLFDLLSWRMISDVPSDVSLVLPSWSGVGRLRLDLPQHTLVSDFVVLFGGVWRVILAHTYTT